MDSHLDLPRSFYLPYRRDCVICLCLFPVSDELYYQLCKQSVAMCCCLATEGAGSNRISMWPCLCATTPARVLPMKCDTTDGEFRTWDCACTLELVAGVEFECFISERQRHLSLPRVCAALLFLPLHLLCIRLVSSAQPSAFSPQPISSLVPLPSPEFLHPSHHLRLVSRVCIQVWLSVLPITQKVIQVI